MLEDLFLCHASHLGFDREDLRRDFSPIDSACMKLKVVHCGSRSVGVVLYEATGELILSSRDGEAALFEERA